MAHDQPHPASHACQFLHKAATKLYSADGQFLRVLNGVTGIHRDVIKQHLTECPVHADRQPRQLGAKPQPHPIMVAHAFGQVQVRGRGPGSAASIICLQPRALLDAPAPALLPASHSSLAVVATPPPLQVDLIALGDDRDEIFRYVLVYQEMFTRSLWLRALATKEPLQVAREVRAVPPGLPAAQLLRPLARRLPAAIIAVAPAGLLAACTLSAPSALLPCRCSSSG